MACLPMDFTREERRALLDLYVSSSGRVSPALQSAVNKLADAEVVSQKAAERLARGLSATGSR